MLSQLKNLNNDLDALKQIKHLMNKFKILSAFCPEYKIDSFKGDIEIDILNILWAFPDASIILDSNNKNIGMKAAKLKLETVVLEVLKNKDASLQQDNRGMNLGMHAANNGLETATNMAAYNEEAMNQKSKQGYGITWYAEQNGIHLLNTEQMNL